MSRRALKIRVRLRALARDCAGARSPAATAAGGARPAALNAGGCDCAPGCRPATPAAFARGSSSRCGCAISRVRELGLPDNASYRSYADLGRRYVVWTWSRPAILGQREDWCFPIAGCVAYRG